MVIPLEVRLYPACPYCGRPLYGFARTPSTCLRCADLPPLDALATRKDALT